MHRKVFLAPLAVVVLTAASSQAQFAVTFTPLTGTTGGSPANTAVFRADLSTLPAQAADNIASITIRDNSGMLGGSTGQFSGFDLDAIILSRTLITNASQVGTLVPLAVFNYSSPGSIFTPGTQRPPTDPKLFGTGPAGNTVDNSVATLGAFDGNSTTSIPGAFGFISMGDNGVLSFNLTSQVSRTSPGPLYLYIGEVGDNGEVAASAVTVSDRPVPPTGDPVPAPAGVVLLLSGTACLVARRAVGRRVAC